jgi:hypothetical protein
MFVSGFTIVRNAIRYQYPVVESIRSMLPLCNEVVVLFGDSDDGTEALLAGLNDPKIKIIPSVWDPELCSGGQVLAVETNKAQRYVNPVADWAVYLQADELLHEADYEHLRNAMAFYQVKAEVDGLLFGYKHFYGHYRYQAVGRNWYRNECRIIRPHQGITAYRDAQGFRKNGQKIRVASTKAHIYHYGWVRPEVDQRQKTIDFHRFWLNERQWQARAAAGQLYQSRADRLQVYQGSHPALMKQRIAAAKWSFEFDCSQNASGWRHRILDQFEKLTGKRLFEFRNYQCVY